MQEETLVKAFALIILFIFIYSAVETAYKYFHHDDMEKIRLICKHPERFTEEDILNASRYCPDNIKIKIWLSEHEN